MKKRDAQPVFFALGATAVVAGVRKAKQRLDLFRAKYPSLTGHARTARWVASLVPFYEFGEKQFFCSDGAPDEIATRRKDGFMRLAALYRERFAETRRVTAQAREGLSDLQFTDAYRVPFQYSRMVREHLRAGSFLRSSQGPTLTDLDGNEFYDLAGSYGVNLFGNDFYKACMEEGHAQVRELGAVLGALHPVVADNVERLKNISGLDEVSFHMSGTEAIMQAVRLARFHTRRTHLVRFCGAYHGWWGDVQPGIGNPVPAHDTYTLAEMSEETLRVLQTRRDIACVLVNPVQALHPNTAAPADSGLIDSARSAHFDKAAYTAWLKKLREVCTERGIALIFDEVFLGFRLARGGAQEYFRVRADLVTYGKTIGGGLPIGVVCGRKRFMKRYREDRPADVCFARGTFNSHPVVMGAMNVFLRRLESPEIGKLYENVNELWDARAQQLNRRLADRELPLRIANISSVWTVCYTTPSRYNWMLQYYLRAHGLALSWIGTGRIIFSLNYTEADFEAVAERFVAATQAMREDGWWWTDPNRHSPSIKRRILRELISQLLNGRRPS